MRWLQAAMCSVLAVGVAAPVVTHAQTRTEESGSTAIKFITSTATITYIGKWHQEDITRSFSGGTAAASFWGPAGSPSPSDTNVPASRATLSFNGTGVSWIGARGPQTGIAHVFLDGVQQPDVDTYTATDIGQEQIQAVPFKVSGLAAGAHTLAIEVSGNKNPLSSGYVIVVDAFDIEGSPSGRIEETGQAAVTYYGTWIQGDATRPYSGGTLAYSYAEQLSGIVPAQCPPPTDPNVCAGVHTRAVFTFSGTGVTWIGFKGPQMGKANVYVDGELKTGADGVDTYAPTEQTQVPIFTSAVLPAGIHTLAIEVRGDKNPLSGGANNGVNIGVDAFDVTP